MKRLAPRLTVLIAFALLPVLGFEAYAEYVARQARQQFMRDEALRLVDLVASQQQTMLKASERVLDTLASTSAVREDVRPRCARMLAELLRRSPEYMNIVVLGRDGQIRCSALGEGAAPNLSDRSFFQTALRTGDFVVGEYMVGRISGKPSINLAKPFTDTQGKLDGVVTVTLNLDWLDEQLKRLPLPATAGVTITDRNGTILARHPGNEVGQPTLQHNLRLLTGDRTEVIQTTNRAGRAVITGYSPPGAEPRGLMVAVWLDREAAFAGVIRANVTGLLLIVVGALLAALIAVMLGRRLIQQPFLQLLAVAERWGRGDLAARSGIPDDVSEFGRLGRAFDFMASELAARQKTESELRAEQAQKAEILDSIDEAFFTLDAGLVFTYVNRRFLEVFSLQRDAVLGREFHAVFPAAVGAMPPRIYRAVIADGRMREFESLSPSLRRWHHIKAYPAPDGGVAVYFADIHDRKLAQEELQRLNQQLERRVREEVAAREDLQRHAAHSERMHALGQLAGGIAHDFNNVLQTIEGAAALIQRRARNDTGIERMARVVREAVERGSSVTGRLLTFGRRTNLTDAPVDVAALLAGTQEVLTHTLGRTIAIEVRTGGPLPPVLADKGQLETALINLATNSRDAMPAGGRLTLSAAAEAVPAADHVHPISLPPGRYVKFTVADTGEGMDAETLKRATEPFFTTKRNGQGTGLGLPMVYGFVEQSRGAMTIASTPGEGTAVMLWLPVTERSAAEAAPSRPAAPTAPAGATALRLLLVDDEALLREVLSEQLQELGYQVAVAADGTEAIDLLRAGLGIDALVTDLSMPGMNGLALIRAAHALQPALPAVLLTGYAGDAPEIAGSQVPEGISVMRKPVRLNELTDRLEALWQLHRQPGSLAD